MEKNIIESIINLTNFSLKKEQCFFPEIITLLELIGFNGVSMLSYLNLFGRTKLPVYLAVKKPIFLLIGGVV